MLIYVIAQIDDSFSYRFLTTVFFAITYVWLKWWMIPVEVCCWHRSIVFLWLTLPVLLFVQHGRLLLMIIIVHLHWF